MKILETDPQGNPTKIEFEGREVMTVYGSSFEIKDIDKQVNGYLFEDELWTEVKERKG